MRIRTDKSAQQTLCEGFAAIQRQFRLPTEFPEAAMAEAREVAMRSNPSDWYGGNRRDLTEMPFVTLDPPTSTDLDQAFFIEKDGDYIVLNYALADVSAFVKAGGAIEQEAWSRGVTIYGLSEKVSLYPTEISQQAASLLPGGPRPAFLVVVAIDPSGRLTLRNIERILCRSRAKLAYTTVNLNEIAYLEEFANRMWINEADRGAMRIQFPEQEVESDPTAPGGVRLNLRTPLYSEKVNSALSLSVNLTLAELFLANHTGLFRVMDQPEARALKRLRFEAHALGINWRRDESLNSLMRRLAPENMDHKRFLLTVRRAGGRAGYAEFATNNKPWHFAIAAPYVHATAPMRRLADRYVLELALQLFQGASPSSELIEQNHLLPPVMDRASSRAKSVAQAVIDLIEAVTLQPRIGEVLQAEVVDAEAKIIQTVDSAIRSRVAQLPQVRDGDMIRVRIDKADPTERRIMLTAVN